jgi:hypothetical protein
VSLLSYACCQTRECRTPFRAFGWDGRDRRSFRTHRNRLPENSTHLTEQHHTIRRASSTASRQHTQNLTPAKSHHRRVAYPLRFCRSPWPTIRSRPLGIEKLVKDASSPVAPPSLPFFSQFLTLVILSRPKDGEGSQRSVHPQNAAVAHR